MSIDLDPRQRAMLQEMGVHVWLPVAGKPMPATAPIEPVKPTAPVAHIAPVALQAPRVQPALPPQAPVTARTVNVDAAIANGIPDMNWPTLAATIDQCQACKLCTGRRAPVFEGANLDASWHADWMVVGDPPDENEEREGVPFADQAGQLLDNMLKAVGLSRRSASGLSGPTPPAENAYITHVAKCRTNPARNPTQEELNTCEHFLRREVALIQPKVIVAMGRFAAQTLLHGSLPEGTKAPFGKLRGQIYHYQGIPVVVTYHPTYLLRTSQDKARAWADLCLAMEALQRGS